MWLTPAGRLCLKHSSPKTHHFNSVLHQIILLSHFGKSKALVKTPYFYHFQLFFPSEHACMSALVCWDFTKSEKGRHILVFFLQLIFPLCVKASRPNRNTLRLVHTAPTKHQQGEHNPLQLPVFVRAM